MTRTALLGVLAGLLAFGCMYAQDAAPKKNPFRHKVALIAGFDEGSQTAASVKKFAASYLDSHASTFAFASKTRTGADRFRVLDATGTVVYEGGDDREAEAAVVNALTDMPVPGQLINGVVLRKFKNAQKSFVMGKVKAEGAGLAPFKAALKSKKPGEAEEAQAILDSIETAKKNLVDVIAEDLESGEKGSALCGIRWFRSTWPSEAKKYDEDFKRLSIDPDAKAGEAAILKSLKKRR